MIKTSTKFKTSIGLSLALSFISALELLSSQDIGSLLVVYITSVITWITLFTINDISHQTRLFIKFKKTPILYWILSLVVSFPIVLLLIYVQYFIKSPNMAILNPSFLPGGIYPAIWVTFISRALQFARDYLIESRKKASENERLAKENIETHFELFKQQVNPHFLFNSLNTLMDLIEEDKEDAIHFLKQFSSVYRYVLSSTDKNLVSLTTELDFLHSYIHMLEKRFRNKLLINVELPDEIMNRFLPPLTLQMLVENSIKHNEVSSEHPLSIDILFENEKVIIRNHIRPKNSFVESNGLGLKNLKNRFDHLVGQPIEYIKINSNFVVRVPLTKDLVA